MRASSSPRASRRERWLGAATLLAVPTVVLGIFGSTAAAASSLQATCPSSSCPHTPPTPNEQGFVNDVLSRINLERRAPQRDYPYYGQIQTLPALVQDPSLEQTAQAAAEHLAAHQTLEDYGGPMPNGEQATGANSAGPGADSASFDEAAMESPGHAAAILSHRETADLGDHPR